MGWRGNPYRRVFLWTLKVEADHKSEIAGGRAHDCFLATASQFNTTVIATSRNPTNVAWNRPQNVELVDGGRVVARLHRKFTVFP